jgi:general stress protein CsbA
VIELDSALLLRIDVLLGLFALTLVIACFALIAVNLIVGLVCLLTVVLAMTGAVRGYQKEYGPATDPDEEPTKSDQSA